MIRTSLPRRGLCVLAVLATALPCALAGALPKGYLVWSRGTQGDSASRKCFRMTLPGKTDQVALTRGEDISCQISPDGKWVAYAKARVAGSDYQSFDRWMIYIVSIQGVGGGGAEIKGADEGYWPSWGKTSATLYYNKANGKHTRIMRASISSTGKVSGSALFLSTKSAFSSIPEINECFVSPDGLWFAGRTRGDAAKSGVGAFLLDPATWKLLGRVGTAGCMPYVAPSGTWGFNSGSSSGIRWGDAPQVSGRKEDQQLIAPRGSSYKCFHPGISTDEKWVMSGQSTSSDQNAGPWDIYIYQLDAKTKKVSNEQLLVGGGFNGWPHIWIDTGTASGDLGPGDDPGEDDDGCAVSAGPAGSGRGAVAALLVFVLVLLRRRLGRPGEPGA